MSAKDRIGMSVALTCKDMAKSVAFYKDKLGFNMKESFPEGGTPMWCNMVLDGQSVMLGAAMDPDSVEGMCAGDAEATPIYHRAAERFKKHPAGVGLSIYLAVTDVDDYAKRIGKKGVEPLLAPRSQFYGIRELLVDDPDGYRLIFFHPIAMETCQSCGMPLKDAQPGQMYCHYCTDAKGKLKSYEEVLEGTVTGFYMGMQKMKRPQAEAAAKEHLANMPAWAMRQEKGNGKTASKGNGKAASKGNGKAQGKSNGKPESKSKAKAEVKAKTKTKSKARG
jgi:uncharacterized glyoxalase superfamily protein PhnB